VSAKDLGTDKEQKIRIESSSGLSESDIDKMLKDAESHAAEDADRKKGIEVRNNADSMIYSTEKTLKENVDKISAEDKAAIEAAIVEVRTALAGTDNAAIEAAMQKLTQTSHKMAEAMYAHAAQAGAGAPGADAGGEGFGPEAGGDGHAGETGQKPIDADFTVEDEKK